MKTFTEIYSAVIQRWPEEIELSDAGPADSEADGQYFPQLSHAWNKAEDAFEDLAAFESLMVWSMFGVFHRYAMQYSREGRTSLKPRDIPKAEIEERFWADLHTDDWPVLIPQYKRE